MLHDLRLFAATDPFVATRMSRGAGLKLLMTLAAVTLFSALSLILAILGALAPSGLPGSVASNDFSAFWAAGRLGLTDPVATLSYDRLLEIQNWPSSDPARYMAFAYPPLWLVAMLPFGALSYAAAWPLYLGVSVGCFLYALWFALSGVRWERPFLVIAGIAAPSALYVLVAGQTTMLWLALLLAATASLLRGGPIVAGLICGLLAFKPQLCPLIAVAFIAYAAPRPAMRPAIPAAAVSLLATCTLPLLYTGWGYWPAWLDAVNEMAARISATENAWGAMIPWYPAFRVAGFGYEAALLLHVGIALALAACVAALWYRAQVHPYLRIAGLLLAIPLVAPTSWYYEALAISLAAVFLAAARYDTTSWRRWHLVLLWLLPGILPPLGTTLPMPLVIAPLATVLMIGVLREARRAQVVV